MEHFSDNREFDLYRDINTRTNGEIYIGVVGPVRTGKSTFIKRFMDLMVLPFMEDLNFVLKQWHVILRNIVVSLKE